MYATRPPPPLLAILVPRLAFERMADPVRLRAGSLSAVFLDQPAARQLDLIRLALPDARSVGILVSGQSKAHAPVLDAAARERGLQLVSSVVEPGGLYPALQSLLPDVDVLLALPDPMMFNSQTAGSILTAAYRRQVPLAGFSPAYVKAGALLALYSTPAQVGRRGGELLRQALAAKPLPLPQPHSPREFTVEVNQKCCAFAGPGAGRGASWRAIAPEGPAMSMSLRKRMTLLALLPAALVAGLLTALSLWHDIDNLEQGFRTRGNALSRQMATAAEYGIFSGQHANLLALTASTLTIDGSVRGAAIVDVNGAILALSGNMNPAGMAGAVPGRRPAPRFGRAAFRRAGAAQQPAGG
jgi:hypothetical protein